MTQYIEHLTDLILSRYGIEETFGTSTVESFLSHWTFAIEHHEISMMKKEVLCKILVEIQPEDLGNLPTVDTFRNIVTGDMAMANEPGRIIRKMTALYLAATIYQRLARARSATAGTGTAKTRRA